MNAENYDWRKHWHDNKPGWYEYHIDIADYTDDKEFLAFYHEIVKWIYDNIPECERHARWGLIDYKFCVKFRYERDFILCALRW